MTTDRRATQSTVTSSEIEPPSRTEVRSRDRSPRPPTIARVGAAEIDAAERSVGSVSIRERPAESWSMDECTLRYAQGDATASDESAPPYELLAMTRRTPTGIAWHPAFGKPLASRPPTRPPTEPRIETLTRDDGPDDLVATPPTGIVRFSFPKPEPIPEASPANDVEVASKVDEAASPALDESTSPGLDDFAEVSVFPRRRHVSSALVIASACVLAFAVIASAFLVRALRVREARARAAHAASASP